MVAFGIGVGLSLKGAQAGGGAALWTPEDLTVGPQVWWDAKDASTITESGGLISQWDDKSGNGNDATAIVGEEPTYATTHVHFDGSNRMMSFTSRLFDTLHAVIFAEWDDTTGDNRVILGDSGTNNWHGDSAASGNLFSAAFGAATFVNGTHHINGTLTLGALARYTSLTSHVLRPDGAVTTGQIGRDRGFAARTMKGKIFEVLLFDYDLTQDEREKLEGYGMHRHGAASSLYVGHPYRDAPPTV